MGCLSLPQLHVSPSYSLLSLALARAGIHMPYILVVQ